MQIVVTLSISICQYIVHVIDKDMQITLVQSTFGVIKGFRNKLRETYKQKHLHVSDRLWDLTKFYT